MTTSSKEFKDIARFVIIGCLIFSFGCLTFDPDYNIYGGPSDERLWADCRNAGGVPLYDMCAKKGFKVIPNISFEECKIQGFKPFYDKCMDKSFDVILLPGYDWAPEAGN